MPIRLSRRFLPAFAAVAAVGLLIPAHGAGAASTPTCLGRKATYVGTDKRDAVTVRAEFDENGDPINQPPVLVLKGGDDSVHVELAIGIAYICGGKGNDEVYIYDGGGFRYYGGDGQDQLVYQPRCPGPTDEGRTHDVEHTTHMVCTTVG